MTTGIFFFHTPKAAGTAVGLALSAMFAPAERCPLIENTEREHQARAGQYQAFRGYAYYGGHYGRDVFAQVADGHAAVTCFRDPASRLLSLYRYFRHNVIVPDEAAQRDNLYPVAVAQRCGFAEFVTTDDPRVELHTRNHHARQLTGSGWAADTQVDLDEAMRFVDTLAWFYVCEYPALSQAWGSQVFGPAFGALARENVTAMSGAEREDEGLTGAVREVIAAKNALDRSLYRRAVRRLLN